MIIEIIKFIMSIIVIITFITDIIIRWEHKKEIKKLLQQIKNNKE